MKSTRFPRVLFHFASLFVLAIVLAAGVAPRAQQVEQPKTGTLVFMLDPAHSKVHWTLGTTLHTVHGTFALRQGTITLDPSSGKTSGEIVADATSGESGNDSRDKKMHKEVLESPRFPEVVFRPDHFEGSVSPQGASNVQLHGTIVLHGAEHEMTVPISAELASDHWSGSGKFVVPFLQWGLKNPSNFLLKVDPSVNIELELSGKLQNPATH